MLSAKNRNEFTASGTEAMEYFFRRYTIVMKWGHLEPEPDIGSE